MEHTTKLPYSRRLRGLPEDSSTPTAFDRNLCRSNSVFILSQIQLERARVKEDLVAHDRAVFEHYQSSRGKGRPAPVVGDRGDLAVTVDALSDQFLGFSL